VFVLTAAVENGAVSRAARRQRESAAQIRRHGLDRKTGKTAWECTAYEHTPHEGSHPQWARGRRRLR
jgi:hypothetical protein